MRRVVFALAAVLPILAACSDEPTAPPSTTPSAAIVHGPRGGNPFFQWAPFLFNPPSDFSADLSPTVEICALGAGGSCALISNGTFTRSSGRGSRIQVIADDPNTRFDDHTAPRYQLIWRTHLFTLNAGQVYRVRVLVGTRELGFVDLKAARTIFEALRFTAQSLSDNNPANDVLGFRIGDPFPLLWGIFTGALCSPLCTPENIGTVDIVQTTVPATGGTFFTPSGHAATRIPALPGGQEVNLVIARVASPCLPTHMQTAGGCYLFETEPSLPPGFAGVLVATCLNPALIDGHWELFKFNPDRPDLGVRQLEHADEQLITDCSDFALRNDRGAARYAKAGLRLVGRSLAAVFGPTPLRAAVENRGFTHTVTAIEDSPFSFFDWGKAVRISKTLGDFQTGTVNTTLSTAPTVEVVTHHNHTGVIPVPLFGVPLDFTFSNPAGVSTTVGQVSDDEDGSASAPWALGSAAGTHSLSVRLRRFSGVLNGVSYTLVETKNLEGDGIDGFFLETPQATFTAQANPLGNEIADQQNDPETGTSFSCPIGSAQSLYQSFTPGRTPLSSVELRFRAGGLFPANGTNTSVAIRSGSVTGSILGRATAFVPGAFGEAMVRFQFSQAINVTIGNLYFIEWVNADTPGILSWMGTTTDAYAGGNLWGCLGTSDPSSDLNFRTFSVVG